MKAKLRLVMLLAIVPATLGNPQQPQLLDTTEIVALVNQDRASSGLPELRVNPVLSLAALAKAEDMLQKNYFAHTSPDGVAPWHWFSTLGYRYVYAGENLAEGFEDARELERAWMESPGHRSNILSPKYSEIGLAVLKKNNKNIVVQFFGATSDSKVALTD